MSCPIGSTCDDPLQCASGSLFDVSSMTGTCESCGPDTIAEGYYCADGASQVCPASFYCPSVEAAQPIQCPEGGFCMEGFTEPSDCSWMVYCPAGSTHVILTWMAVLFVALIGVAVGAICLTIHFYKRHSMKRSDKRGLAHHRTTELYNSVTQALTGVYLHAGKMQGFTDDIKYSPVDISFEHLSMTLRHGSKAKILDNVSGRFPPGSLVAVMGPSGGGKSTFMNALANRAPYGDVSGKVFINGYEGSVGEYPRLVGFVPQDDIMFDRLTVYQNLLYSAMVRLPRSMPREVKLKIVEDVIEVLDLEQIRHTVVGSPEKRGISGGQKKRVNIGLELVAYPRVLFLDEPTSGLDSAASMAVTKCLARMRTLGITVVCVIHQPRFSIFSQFTHCLLLGKGGKTVYMGKTRKIREYFAELGFLLPAGENVADWFIDIVTGSVNRYQEDGNVDQHWVKEDLFEYWKSFEADTVDHGRGPPLARVATRRITQILTEADKEDLVTRVELSQRLSRLLEIGVDEELSAQSIHRLTRLLNIECEVAEAYEVHRVLRAEHEVLTCKSLATTMHGGAIREAVGGTLRELPDVSKLKDREIASVWRQLLLFTQRNLALVSIPQVFLDLSLTFMAAIVIGSTVAFNAEYESIPSTQVVGLMFYGIMVGAGALNVYGKEKLVFSRESTTGISIPAYWASKTVMNVVDNLLVTLVFTLTWYFVTSPFSSPLYGFIIFFAFTWWVSGFAQLVTVVFPTEIALLLAVIVPTQFVTMFGGVSPPVTQLQTFQLWATYFGCGLYSIELLTLAELTALPPNVMRLESVVNLLETYDYSEAHIVRDFLVLFGVGVAWRLLTLAWLLLKVWWVNADLRWLKAACCGCCPARKRGGEDEKALSQRGKRSIEVTEVENV